ncbi:MAG: ATP-dependent helicase HrpB [Myxococcales bacterium]|nr:ATP-dependent helicase HrpB [Myxococcales bacterium]
MDRLPICDILPQITSSLRSNSSLVLLAPPGAGKTTVVPGALVDAGLVDGQLWVLEPRRLAARLASQRVAYERGGRLGGEVGYRVRFDNQTSASSKIVYVTEGVLTQRLIGDPLLEGLGAVVLDEFHERSIHADLNLSMLYEVQQVRPELRIVVMSATLEPGPVSLFLDGCPIIESKGTSFPVTIHYAERPDVRAIEERVASTIKRALRNPEAKGDILTFLPGAGAIRRTQHLLGNDLARVAVVKRLHGDMEAEAQDGVVRARKLAEQRRVILSTNIAESSLTIPGVDVVVDSGLSKLVSYDANAGLDHLEVRKISVFSAEQRAGRAGRSGPGQVYRVWTLAEHKLLLASESPEITRLDLCQTVLQICAWSGRSPREFNWFEAPPTGRLRAAVALLRLLGALPADEQDFRLTPLGEMLRDLPVHPRLGKVLLTSMAYNQLERGSKLAALICERDILVDQHVLRDTVGPSDLLDRLERLDDVQRGYDPQARGVDSQRSRVVLRLAKQLTAIANRMPLLPVEPEPSAENALLRSILAGFPDRVGKLLGEGLVQLASGGRARLAPTSVVKDGEFLVAVQIEGQGSAKIPFIRMASSLDVVWLRALGHGVKEDTEARYLKHKDRVEGVRTSKFGLIDLSVRACDVDTNMISAALEKAAYSAIDQAIPLTDELMNFFWKCRLIHMHMPELQLESIEPDQRIHLVPQLVVGRSSLAEVQKTDIRRLLLERWPQIRGRFDQLVPDNISVPSGRRIQLKYRPEGPPVVSVRLQEVFGLQKTPTVLDGKVSVLMELLAPNHRPVQVTQDLESFWANTYYEVRKELRRRYPKHQWPERPEDGVPSHRTRPRSRER